LVPSANFTSRQNFTPAFISKVQSGQPHSTTRSELLSFCDAAPGMRLILVSCRGPGGDSRHVNILKQSRDICVFLPRSPLNKEYEAIATKNPWRNSTELKHLTHNYNLH
jgi:hypothetical protein